MSWAAHEFENYFLQKHVGLKASFLGIVVGALATDLFTKSFVYAADDPAMFHRGWDGWPSAGPTHSFIFGVFLATLILALTKSRSWALGVLIGQWAHVLTDIADTAGVMPFFPFSTEPVTISMWKHAAVQGRYGDAAAYYSSLAAVWDLFWFVVVLVFAWRTLTRNYFRTTIVPADPWVWGWLHRTFHLSERGLLLFYRGFIFYGLGRMISWFLFARTDSEFQTDFQPIWGGPDNVAGTPIAANDLSDAGFWEVVLRTSVGGVLFALFLILLWKLFGRRLWERGIDPPAVHRGPGLQAIFSKEMVDSADRPSSA